MLLKENLHLVLNQLLQTQLLRVHLLVEPHQHQQMLMLVQVLELPEQVLNQTHLLVWEEWVDSQVWVEWEEWAEWVEWEAWEACQEVWVLAACHHLK